MEPLIPPLYAGQLIRLTGIDLEKDPETEARWMRDPAYLRSFGEDVAFPKSAWQVKKQYEALEKDADEHATMFHFQLRPLDDERLLGFARVCWISWPNASGFVQLAIGDPADRRKGLGADALGVLLRYAFDELNLHRLSARVPEYSLPAQRLFGKFGFQVEVRARRMLERDDRRWDQLEYGLLRSEWAIRAA
jgi:RimJ/RimL family protein N-acetyltransferase